MGPKLSEQLCYALYSTSRAITQAYKPLLEPLNLTYPQYVVMMVLWEYKDVKITDIAKISGISNATLSPLIKRLELNCYLTRDFVKDDERQKRITLTRTGKVLAKKALKASELALCATGLSEKQTEQIMFLCEEIKTNLIE